MGKERREYVAGDLKERPSPADKKQKMKKISDIDLSIGMSVLESAAKEAGMAFSKFPPKPFSKSELNRKKGGLRTFKRIFGKEPTFSCKNCKCRRYSPCGCKSKKGNNNDS